MGKESTSASGLSPEKQHMAFHHLLTVFAVSTGMVGVCLTAMGVVQLLHAHSGVKTWCDEMLVVDSFLFGLGSICNFTALRLRFEGPWRRFQLVGELFLALGLLVMVLATAVLVVEM